MVPNVNASGLINQLIGIIGNATNSDQPQSHGVSDEFLNNLPQMPVDKEADCNICLEKVKRDDFTLEEEKKTAELPCGHDFHRICINGWLKDHDSCPVCRFKLG